MAGRLRFITTNWTDRLLNTDVADYYWRLDGWPSRSAGSRSDKMPRGRFCIARESGFLACTFLNQTPPAVPYLCNRPSLGTIEPRLDSTVPQHASQGILSLRDPADYAAGPPIVFSFHVLAKLCRYLWTEPVAPFFNGLLRRPARPSFSTCLTDPRRATMRHASLCCTTSRVADDIVASIALGSHA